MQREHADLHCPLCKRTMSATRTPPSVGRLCESCRQIVHTILPGNRLRHQFVAQSAPEQLIAEPANDTFEDQFESQADFGGAASVEASELEDAGSEPQFLHRYEPEVTIQSPVSIPQPEFSKDSNYLPESDYTLTEWPLLIEKQPRRSGINPGILLALMVLAAVVVAAVYFLIYRPFFAGGGAPKRTEVSQVQVPSSEPDHAGALTLPAPEAIPVPPADDSVPAEDAQAASPDESQGHLTLQVASFPSEDGANEFAGKLRAAGIPAYVISADLDRKGRWYRVRIGKFSSQREAEVYAGQSRQRAKTVGVNLQVIVVAHEEP